MFAVIAVLSSAEAVKVYFPACGCTVLAEHTEVKSNDTIQPGKRRKLLLRYYFNLILPSEAAGPPRLVLLTF